MAIEHGEVTAIDGLSAYLESEMSTLHKLAQEGKPPGQKVGKHRQLHEEAVSAWVRHPELTI